MAPHPPFSLWLEFEEYAGGYPGQGADPECDFCNAMVRMDGRLCGLTVWTFAFLDHARRHDDAGLRTREIARYLLPPDLLVERLDRGLIEEAIAAILRKYPPSPAQWRWHDEETAA